MTSPSTESSIPPRNSRSIPVAVTMMSPSSSLPDRSRSPRSVNSSTWSVTTDAAPSLIALKKSPAGPTASWLAPGVVRGGEVGDAAVAGRQLPFEHPAQQALDELGTAAAQPEEPLRGEGLEPLDRRARVPPGQRAAQRVGD